MKKKKRKTKTPKIYKFKFLNIQFRLHLNYSKLEISLLSLGNHKCQEFFFCLHKGEYISTVQYCMMYNIRHRTNILTIAYIMTNRTRLLYSKKRTLYYRVRSLLDISDIKQKWII